MRVLMVSPYPPMRGGIATYAGQAVLRLQQQGHEVVVASPEPSDAEHVLDVRASGAGHGLARLARTCDRVVAQFYPEMLGAPDSTLWTRSLSLMRLARGLRAAPSSELVFHEVNYGAGPSAPLLRRLVRPVWKLADELVVHTERERKDFAQAFGINASHIRVVSQGEYLVPRTDASRAEAREELGLPAEAPMLLAIGFLQPNKGFDRALEAFGRLKPSGARLFVVGSSWREDEAGRAYVEKLRRLTEKTPGAQLRVGYLGDEDFDRWIVASDALVLPYREGWSSNVMERGLLYGRPVIMSRIGGMAEQGIDRPEVTLVDDDAALVEVLREFVDARAHNVQSQSTPPPASES